LHRLKRNGRIPCFQPAGKRGKLLFPLDAIQRASAPAEQSGPQSDRVEPTSRLPGRQPAWMEFPDSLEDASDAM
jgi:hypothetical protein